MGLAELIEQNNSEEVNDDKDVRVSAIRGRKITTTINKRNTYGWETINGINKDDFVGGWTKCEGEKDMDWDYWLIKDKLPLEQESQYFLGTLKRADNTMWGLISFDGYWT